jgi:hypothetical protein
MFYPDLVDKAGWVTWEQRYEEELQKLHIEARITGSPKAYDLESSLKEISSDSGKYRWLIRSRYAVKKGLIFAPIVALLWPLLRLGVSTIPALGPLVILLVEGSPQNRSLTKEGWKKKYREKRLKRRNRKKDQPTPDAT